MSQKSDQSLMTGFIGVSSGTHAIRKLTRHGTASHAICWLISYGSPSCGVSGTWEGYRYASLACDIATMHNTCLPARSSRSALLFGCLMGSGTFICSLTLSVATICTAQLHARKVSKKIHAKWRMSVVPRAGSEYCRGQHSLLLASWTSRLQFQGA